MQVLYFAFFNNAKNVTHFRLSPAKIKKKKNEKSTSGIYVYNGIQNNGKTWHRLIGSDKEVISNK